MKQNGISSLKKGGFGEFYPFGMLLPGRNSSEDSYRYGYQGSEMDNEVKDSKGTSYTTYYREYNPRIAQWSKVDPLIHAWESPYVAMANNPIFYNDVFGNDVIINGSEADKKAFLDKLNQSSGLTFKIDNNGKLALTDPNATSDDFFDKLALEAINSGLTVTFKLARGTDPGKEYLMIDSFGTGEIDLDDLLAGTDEAFKDNLIHFTYERFLIPNYDKNKGTVSDSEFDDAHEAAIQLEAKYIKELYPNAKVGFISEGVDKSSYKVDDQGNGTYNYVFDFGDVSLIFVLEVVDGANTRNVVENYFENQTPAVAKEAAAP